MDQFEKILYSQEDAIARITLNRPEKRNALDGRLVAEIKEALDIAVGARVVVISGAGSDFCSGADLAGLRSISQATAGENLEDALSLGDLFIRIRRHPLPIVAAVRGRALAGGCGLASACDIVLAAESARFGYPEVNIGFIPAMVMAMLRRSVSEKRAFELITGGEQISASRAEQIGLINRVYPDDDFEEGVESALRELAGKPPAAISLAKSLLYQMDAMGFAESIEAGASLNAIARSTEECRKGVEKFLNRGGKADPGSDS